MADEKPPYVPAFVASHVDAVATVLLDLVNGFPEPQCGEKAVEILTALRAAQMAEPEIIVAGQYRLDVGIGEVAGFTRPVLQWYFPRDGYPMTFVQLYLADEDLKALPDLILQAADIGIKQAWAERDRLRKLARSNGKSHLEVLPPVTDGIGQPDVD